MGKTFNCNCTTEDVNNNGPCSETCFVYAPDDISLSEIARQAWMDCPLDGDHWEATVQAVRSKVIEEASKLVENAFNEGFHEGMKDVTSSRGGNGWYDSKAKQALTALKDQSNDAT